MGRTGSIRLGLAGLGLAVLLSACSGPTPTATPAANAPAFPLTSPAFAGGAPIPREYTCDGAGSSPPLAWWSLPAGTTHVALIVDDPDAPGGSFVHWVLYDVPATAANLAATPPSTAERFAGGLQGRNSGGKLGYTGPCPPQGNSPHHYHFTLYALDAPLGIAAGATREQVQAALVAHLRGQATLTGTYGRP